MSTLSVSSRYVTSEFKETPLVALADIMGLKRYSSEIVSRPEVYGPILSGIATFRLLSSAQRAKVQRSIMTQTPGFMMAPLRTLISDQSVQHFWYMWSLSDGELKEFYRFSKRKAEITDQYDVIDLPDPKVATLAAAVYALAEKGIKTYASEIISSTLRAPIVQQTSQKLGLSVAQAKIAGSTAVAALICVSVVNFMAHKESNMAKRELAARGLLVYSDL
ncbi:hypothetical protein [Marinobacter sp. ANT_B65]|uniref:hypothetical protein n=1 Tax=Marinobacter sp. ANT_B65 TaxID=2039467 RepID=UPI000BBECED3|nr:hypothetical protein [Marinobacter sp. ANT_B65]PCM43132.1 hypothetical protein CPA50_16390 [Marinobacter sp. ANT_B65]